MKSFKLRHLLVLLTPVGIGLAVVLLFLSSRSFLSDQSCGCGPPDVEASGEFDTSERVAFFNDQQVDYDLGLLAMDQTGPMDAGLVLGVSADEKWVEIDLSDQKLFARRGGVIDHEFLVSTGKWAPTPTGEFRVWIKLRYTKMEGGVKGTGTYYYLPNVPYTQYFYRGYGLHGAYWHNNFGHPMSHGCVNLSIPDSEKLFYWTTPVMESRSVAYSSKDNPGTRVVIHE